MRRSLPAHDCWTGQSRRREAVAESGGGRAAARRRPGDTAGERHECKAPLWISARMDAALHCSLVADAGLLAQPRPSLSAAASSAGRWEQRGAGEGRVVPAPMRRCRCSFACCGVVCLSLVRRRRREVPAQRSLPSGRIPTMHDEGTLGQPLSLISLLHSHALRLPTRRRHSTGHSHPSTPTLLLTIASQPTRHLAHT